MTKDAPPLGRQHVFLSPGAPGELSQHSIIKVEKPAIETPPLAARRAPRSSASEGGPMSPRTARPARSLRSTP